MNFFGLSFSCNIRFPSTQLRVGFSSLIDEDNPPDCDHYSNGDQAESETETEMRAVTQPPTRTLPELKSPCPSPTGTIRYASEISIAAPGLESFSFLGCLLLFQCTCTAQL